MEINRGDPDFLTLRLINPIYIESHLTIRLTLSFCISRLCNSLVDFVTCNLYCNYRPRKFKYNANSFMTLTLTIVDGNPEPRYIAASML